MFSDRITVWEMRKSRFRLQVDQVLLLTRFRMVEGRRQVAELELSVLETVMCLGL